MRDFGSLEELAAAVGESLGPSDSITVDQQRIALFADATGDHQWIHLDAQRAAKGPFGTQIAHGYLTLSLLPVLMGQLFHVRGLAMMVNYGLNKVRFPSPLPSGSAVTATAHIDSVVQVPGGKQLQLTVTVTADGGGKPCCVAESVSRMYPTRPAGSS